MKGQEAREREGTSAHLGQNVVPSHEHEDILDGVQSNVSPVSICDDLASLPCTFGEQGC